MSASRPPAPTPNDLMEGERERMKSVSLLRRRAFEESSRLHEDRESAIHQELQAAKAELSSLRAQLTEEQEAAQVTAAAFRAPVIWSLLTPAPLVH